MLACQSAVSSEIAIGRGMIPLPDQQLSEYRGGFNVNNDYVVSIGLRVQTTVNGRLVFNNQIANLVIENGVLKQTKPEVVAPAAPKPIETVSSAKAIVEPSTNSEIAADVQDRLVNIVQVGDGNVIEGEVDSTIVPQSIADIKQTVSEQVASSLSQVESVTVASNITNVIQNTLDHSVLGLNTIVDIDANVGEMLKQQINNRRLHDALLIGQY